ncbi:MAG TPA: hypothetical protein VKW76_00500 [Candidatus Binatia bacterium]|nr:hypothetical protein [Candidatus Binatia bacterium]
MPDDPTTLIVRCRFCDAVVIRTPFCLRDPGPLEQHLRMRHPERLEVPLPFAVLLRHFTLTASHAATG